MDAIMIDRESGDSDFDMHSDFEVVQIQDARLTDKEANTLIKWLQPTDYNAESSEFRRHLLSRAPGTGAWLCETERYRAWYSSQQHGSLWIKGVPGAGKSVLAASTVEHLKESEAPETPVLFFFFRHIILANRHSISLIRDWLAQLLPHSVALQGALHPLLGTALNQVSDNVLWECLLKGLADVPKVFCVADALDEMDNQGSTAFLRRLNSLATFRPERVKLFMTSRPRQDLQSALSAASIIHISLEEDKVGKEIEVFIRHRLARDTLQPPASRDTLSREIATRSRGLFLYARLLIDQIVPELDNNPNIDVKALPIHLEDMYSRMLAKQSSEVGVSADVQAALLGLITHSTRPLRLRELAGFVEQKMRNNSLERSKSIARFACHPLLQILEDETVQVIHHSFTEFLLDASRVDSTRGAAPNFPVLYPAEIQRQLAMDCLGSLADALELVEQQAEDSQLDPSITMPFFAYARQNVVHHVSCNKDVTVSPIFAAIDGIYQATDAEAPSEEIGPSRRTAKLTAWLGAPTRLDFAATAGLTTYCCKLVEAAVPGQPLWSLSSNWRTSPFGQALQKGHLEILKTLWTPEHKDQLQDYIMDGMISVATSGKNAAVLEFLLAIGCDPRPRGDEAREPLLKSLRDSSVNCLRLLQPYLTAQEVLTLFHSLASCGFHDILAALASYADTNTTLKTEASSALYRACAAENKIAGHIDCVRFLLQYCPDVNRKETIVRYGKIDEATRQPEKERTVLHALAGSWYDGNHEISCQIFNLLRDAGADLEAKDGMGDTPILCLFPKSFSKSVRKPLSHLLRAGADVTVRDNQGAAIIHRTAEGHIDTKLIEILLQHGVDVNSLWKRNEKSPGMPLLALIWDDTDWGNFLSWNSEKGHEFVEHNTRAELAAFLVRHGATIDAGGAPASVISKAMQSCDLETFKMLLRTSSGEHPLDEAMFMIKYHLPTERGFRKKPRAPRSAVGFIRAMVAVGVSTEVTNKEGATPLLESVQEVDIFNAFVEAGAQKDARDSAGRGALHRLFSGKGHSLSIEALLDHLKALVEQGFDPLQLDNEGISLLHLAAGIETKIEGKRLLVHQLVEYGLSPRASTSSGLTPLHSFFDGAVTWDSRIQIRSRENAENLVAFLSLLQETKDGINIDAQDLHGVTPLHMAALGGLKSSSHDIQVLRDNGADLKMPTNDGRRILHLAAMARDTALVQFLVDQAPDLVHSKDERGRTPLFDACASGVLESVMALLRAGADVFVADNSGWTPLHACAEFAAEQRSWEVDRDTSVDRSKPYIPLPYLRRELTFGKIKLDRDLGRFSAPSYVLEAPDLAILSVTNALLAAGADPDAVGGQAPLTPVMRAFELNCRGMLMAFSEERIIEPSHFEDLDSAEQHEVLRNPWGAISTLTPVDVVWLKNHEANFFCTISQEERENNVFERPFRRSHSFLQGVAAAGLTEIMAELGDAARRDENPDTTPIDKWTLEIIAGNSKCRIPNNKGYGSEKMWWKPEEIKTVGDYLCATEWVVEPLLHIACQRVAPNLEMVRVLVEKCGVDVNAPTVTYQGRKPERGSSKHYSILPLLASKQHLWHLDALRFLVFKGADVNACDKDGKTALHHACAGDGMFTGRFVKLLLELGANPHAEDASGRSCISLAENADVLRILTEHGLDLASSLKEKLWLGIGGLNIDLVRAALDADVNVNRMEESPIYRNIKLDWEIHASPISEGNPTLPLAGALLYTDYEQDEHSSTGEDLRASIIRLLLDRGADLFGPYQYSYWGEDREEKTVIVPLMHRVFREVQCKRAYLEVLLERGRAIDFARRDDQGQTVFLAACNSALAWSEDFDKERFADSYDVIDEEAQEIWDSSGLFLKMMDLGADITSVDKDGNNALHILLSNPSVFERHILEFLKRPASHPLLLANNNNGFTPLQLAFRILRPATVDVLLALGADLSECQADPEGFTPLHRIAAQCLSRHIDIPRGRSAYRALPQPKDFLPACKRLWAQCLAAGMDIDAPDFTAQGDPPLFHYLRNHASTVHQPSGYFCANFQHDLRCHVENFEDFFATANLSIRNKQGSGALHIVAFDVVGGGGRRRTGYPKYRPGKHDAEVFRFLVSEKGLDPLLEDQQGRSSLDVAAERRRASILQLFSQKR